MAENSTETARPVAEKVHLIYPDGAVVCPGDLIRFNVIDKERRTKLHMFIASAPGSEKRFERVGFESTIFFMMDCSSGTIFDFYTHTHVQVLRP